MGPNAITGVFIRENVRQTEMGIQGEHRVKTEAEIGDMFIIQGTPRIFGNHRS